jgi:FKBP-type peptidyl-prolyl cis-trans isomerase (trigger factor)
MTDTKTAPKSTSSTTGIAENTSFELVLPWDSVKNAYEHEISHLAGRVKLSGFRPGKVPAPIAEKHLDQEHIVTHVLQKVVPALLEKRFQEEGEKYHPISQPSVQPLNTPKGADWTIKVSFAESPVIKLGDYKKTVTNSKKASDAEIKEQEQARSKQLKATPAAKKSDDATKKTESAPATELTDEQKKEVRLRHIFKDLIAAVAPAVPELLVREETEYRLRNLAHSLQQFKIELEEYLKRRGATLEQIVGEFQAEALASLQLEFILSEIGKNAKVEVTPAEREAALKDIKDEKLQTQYKEDESYKARLDNTIYRRKIIDHLLSL